MRPAPCDPGSGSPVTAPGCPDPEPESAWLTVRPDGALVLHPFRTYGNDAEGRVYAERRGLEFPFSNDHFDAGVGPDQTFELDSDTVCTGIILVGYRGPLGDHVVDCSELTEVAARRRVTVAVWRDDGEAVQVSELYRP
jgi:hypothetical protein